MLKENIKMMLAAGFCCLVTPRPNQLQSLNHQIFLMLAKCFMLLLSQMLFKAKLTQVHRHN